MTWYISNNGITLFYVLIEASLSKNLPSILNLKSKNVGKWLLCNTLLVQQQKWLPPFMYCLQALYLFTKKHIWSLRIIWLCDDKVFDQREHIWQITGLRMSLSSCYWTSIELTRVHSLVNSATLTYLDQTWKAINLYWYL